MDRAAAHGGLSEYVAGGCEYRLATRADEPVVRELLARIATGGDVQLSFRREPDAFGAAFGARAQEFIVARESRSGEPVGLCERVVRDCFVNGEIRALPYLAGLRVVPGFRHRLAVLRGGFEAVRRLLGNSRDLPFALTSIMNDNAIAQRVLGANLRGMPCYQPVGEYSTFALSARGRARRFDGVEIGVRDADRDELADRLLAGGVRRQFASAWTASALRDGAASGGPASGDWLVIRRGGRIRACAALWDQSARRQLVVAGYSRWLARSRGLVNVAARLAGLPRLPAPGEPLRCAYLSHVTVDEHALQDLAVLVDAARARARDLGIDVVLAGCATSGPAAAVVRSLPRRREYRSTLYVVHWADQPVPALDGRPVEPELALL